MQEVVCVQCGKSYPQQGVPHSCLHCGGVFDFSQFPMWQDIDSSLPGIWPYHQSFGLPDDAPIISLGEGNTPLNWIEAFGHRVALKCEFMNPTGSYKDRGAATLVSFLSSRRVQEAVEDSSGNAGAAFAAYAARASMRAIIYMPSYTSGPKRAQIESYGAMCVSISGTRQDVADATIRVVNDGAVYASHAHLPYVLPGYATIAYEIVQQLGGAPGTIISPVGQGNLILGIGRGFALMQRASIINHLPRLIGVQAQACSPYVSAMDIDPETSTLAEGVRITKPVRKQVVIQSVLNSSGKFLAVEESAILPGRDSLAQLGFYVEPTTAIVWDGLRQIIEDTPQPIVLILSGSGLKFLSRGNR